MTPRNEHPDPSRESLIREAKKDIRNAMLAHRRAEHADELVTRSARIVERLEHLPLWRDCRFPCIYISCKPGEVDTHSLIRRALASGRRVAVPITLPGKPDLEVVELRDFERLVPGHFGLLDPPPESRLPLDAPEWDLVIAPGVAFDRLGHRIGFGRGYYDRLLTRRPVAAVALAFSFQVLPSFETLSHDIDMDCIVTELETLFPDR